MLPPPRDHETAYRPNDREDGTLGEQLLHQAHAPRAEGDADADLAAARRRAGEHQVGDVGETTNSTIATAAVRVNIAEANAAGNTKSPGAGLDPRWRVMQPRFEVPAFGSRVLEQRPGFEYAESGARALQRDAGSQASHEQQPAHRALGEPGRVRHHDRLHCHGHPEITWLAHDIAGEPLFCDADNHKPAPLIVMVRPIAAGSPANRFRQYASLMTTTGSAPVTRSSVAANVRPEAAPTPRTEKKFPVTKRPWGCSPSVGPGFAEAGA